MSNSSGIGTQLAGGRRPFMAMFTRAPLLPEAIAFQDPIDEICARPAPTFLRGTLYLVAVLFISLLVIATFAKVDVVVIASGRLTTATPPIVLQPMERSIVRDLRVHPGDMVTKGQVLATLDPTFADADTGSLRRQLHMLQAQTRRQEAEEASRPFSIGTSADAEEALQKTLYDQRQAEYATRLHVFDEDIERLRAGVRTLEDGRGAFGRELGVAREVEGMRSALLQAQTGSRLHLLEAQSARLRRCAPESTIGGKMRLCLSRHTPWRI